MLGARTILRMRQQHLHVADPQKLLAGAQIDTLLFDKTGTLTFGQVGPADLCVLHSMSGVGTQL